MTSSTTGVELIKRFEGCRLHSYQDVVGIWTIGWGATGKAVGPKLVWTQAQAESRLQSDVAHYGRFVALNVRVNLTQNQFDALVSFTYNVGMASFHRSTLLKLLNTGDYAGAADQFTRWSQAGHKVRIDLLKRRTAERDLFLS